MVNAIYAMNWTEYERGWGPRPDGVSLHASKEAAFRFRNQMEADYGDCYTRGEDPRLIVATNEMVEALGDKESVWFKVTGNINMCDAL